MPRIQALATTVLAKLATASAPSELTSIISHQFWLATRSLGVVAMQQQHQQQRRSEVNGVGRFGSRRHHQHHSALPPPTAPHSADSLTSGMQRLSVSNRRGLTTTTSLTKPATIATAKPTAAAPNSSGTRRRMSGIGSGKGRPQVARPGQVTSLSEVANLLSGGRVSNIVVMAGAGISTASGIPDFRTPGTGLYDNLQQFKIPYPEAIFDLDYFFVNPKPFFALAKELYPSGRYRPNLVHCFCRLLHDKGLLSRLYTQNIDGLERMSGIPAEKLVEAHGTFATATCTHCCRQLPAVHVRPMILEGLVPICSKLRGQGACPGVLKPDIVFFGEDLPSRFYHYLRDFAQCDLLIVLGTSLQVEPFAGIVDATRLTVPRLLINRDAVGPFRGAKPRRPNDLAATGDLVERVSELASLAGWSEELLALIDRINLDIDACPDPFESAMKAAQQKDCGNGNNNNNNNNSPLRHRNRQQHLLPPLPPSKLNTKSASSAILVANSNNNARRAMESGTATSGSAAAAVVAGAVRVKPGVPLFYRHRRAKSQQRLPTSSSTSSSEDSDEDSTASSSSDD